MRIIFSLIGLLVVVAIVGVVAKNQLSAVSQLPSPVPAATSANIAEQSKQIQSQAKDQLNDVKAAAEARDKAMDSGNPDKPAEKTGSAY